LYLFGARGGFRDPWDVSLQVAGDLALACTGAGARAYIWLVESELP
jgi:hypothetical protein